MRVPILAGLVLALSAGTLPATESTTLGLLRHREGVIEGFAVTGSDGTWRLRRTVAGQVLGFRRLPERFRARFEGLSRSLELLPAAEEGRPCGELEEIQRGARSKLVCLDRAPKLGTQLSVLEFDLALLMAEAAL